MRLGVALAIGLSLLGCRNSAEPSRSPASPAGAPAPTDAPVDAIDIRAIRVEGDGRVVPIALENARDGVVLFTTEPGGLGRFAVDPGPGTAARTASWPTDGNPHVVAHDPAHDRLWWIAARETVRVRHPRSHGFPVADSVLTISNTVAHSQGMQSTIAPCPTAAGVAGAAPRCDHQIRTAVAVAGGLVLGGHFNDRVGATTGQPWIGLVSETGSLVREERLQVGGGSGWVDALASSDAGVLAVSWTSHTEPFRVTFEVFDPVTLESLGRASRSTPSFVSRPWSSAVAALDGGFWVALATTDDEITILTIARDGAIAVEHAIEGASLPTTSSQALVVRDREPWLLVAEPYAEPHPVLRVARVDPTTGATSERRAVGLPADLRVSRMLALDHGFVLAGRVGVERPLVVWIPLPRAPGGR